MLRLGLARTADWSGSAVDFVAKGLARHCQANGITKVSRVFEQSSIQLLDEIVELNNYERNQQGGRGPGTRMFLLVNYDQAAMVQMGPTLRLLENIDARLPAAFFQVFARNLSRWTRIYDFRDAEFLAENQVEMLDKSELKESFYPEVKKAKPSCLKAIPEYPKALRFLRRAVTRITNREHWELIRLCLQMHEQGDGFELAYPSELRDTVPELENYMENSEQPGPGALLVFDEDDLVEACFTEEMQYLGQEMAIGSTAILTVDLTQPEDVLDREVKSIFDYVGAMLRSLSCATALILQIRGIYDEDLRQRRLESRV
jgi:hypothetical protein